MIAKIDTTDRPEGFVPVHITLPISIPICFLQPGWYRLILACLAACMHACMLCSVGSRVQIVAAQQLAGKAGLGSGLIAKVIFSPCCREIALPEYLLLGFLCICACGFVKEAVGR
jgi:hypothetical protein